MYFINNFGKFKSNCYLYNYDTASLKVFLCRFSEFSAKESYILDFFLGDEVTGPGSTISENNLVFTIYFIFSRY